MAKFDQIWSHCSGAITDAKKVLCYWTRRAPRTFCRKDEKNGDDDGTDSAAPNQIVTSSSEFPRELEGCQLCLGHTSRRSQQVLQRPRLMQIIENFLFLLQWTATVAGRSRFAASLNKPLCKNFLYLELRLILCSCYFILLSVARGQRPISELVELVLMLFLTE